MIDEELYELCKDIVIIFSRYYIDKKAARYRIEKDELTNQLYVDLKEWINSDKYIGQGINYLKKHGILLLRKYVVAIKNQTQQLPQSRCNSIKLIPLRDSSEVTDRLLDRNAKLSQWCKTRHTRLVRALDSRVCAYLHLVEELSIHEIATYFNRSWQAVNCAIHVVITKRKKMALKERDVVLIKTDNLFFNNMLGRVKETTDYGALVVVESHSYPQRIAWELRCTSEEMLYIGTLDEKELIPKIANGEKIPDSNKKPAHSNKIGKYDVVAEVSQELCPKCQGLMVRTESCLTCQSCGESSGGCG